MALKIPIFTSDLTPSFLKIIQLFLDKSYLPVNFLHPGNAGELN